jgi:hypothetical protein
LNPVVRRYSSDLTQNNNKNTILESPKESNIDFYNTKI